MGLSVSTFKTAGRVQRIAPSPSALASQRARELRSTGVDMIALSSGEPDFQPPSHVIEAANRAMLEGQTKYTTISGTAELKAAVAEKFRSENGLDYSEQEVMISTGAKQVIFNGIMATVDTGDEVIVPAPYWIAYEQIVQVAGGTPVIVPCTEKNDFKLTAELLERAITPNTRWLILNSPANPSGGVYSESELKEIAAVLEKSPQVWTLCDEIYEHIIFDGREFLSLAAVAPELRDRILTVNGVSKTYAMTGFRIGYCGGPRKLLAEMFKMQSQCTSGPSSVGQAAAAAALSGPQSVVEEQCRAYESRRDLVVSMLNQSSRLTCRRPQGAFYVYPSCAGVIGLKTPEGKPIETDKDFVLYLMDAFNVATVHGAAYGHSPHFRISIAASMDDLQRGCDRILDAVSRLN